MNCDVTSGLILGTLKLVDMYSVFTYLFVY